MLGQCLGDLSGIAVGLFLLKGVDQLNCGEEADLSAMMLNGLSAYGRCHVGFVGARAANEDHVLRPDHRLATVQLTHDGFIDLTRGEVEVGEVPGRVPAGGSARLNITARELPVGSSDVFRAENIEVEKTLGWCAACIQVALHLCDRLLGQALDRVCEDHR